MTTAAPLEIESVNPPGDPVTHPVDRAFDDLYETEWSGLLALAWSLVGSWPEAEDLLQDVFADTYRRWEDIRNLDRAGAWVRRGVINRAASVHRHRDVARRGQLRIVSARDDSENPDRDHTGDTAVRRVTDPAFWDAVRALPERQAAAIALHYLEDRSTDEIAEILDCRPGTVKAHLHRGRRNLARRLGLPTEPARGEPDTDAPTATETTEPDEEVGS